MPGASTPAAVRSPDDDRPAINTGWLLRMQAERPDFLARLFEVFLAEEPGRIARLGEAVAAGDVKMVLHLAHALKGAAATLGMERLRDASRELELAAKSGNTPLLAAPFARVEQETAKVFVEIREAGSILPADVNRRT